MNSRVISTIDTIRIVVQQRYNYMRGDHPTIWPTVRAGTREARVKRHKKIVKEGCPHEKENTIKDG